MGFGVQKLAQMHAPVTAFKPRYLIFAFRSLDCWTDVTMASGIGKEEQEDLTPLPSALGRTIRFYGLVGNRRWNQGEKKGGIRSFSQE